MFGFQEGYAIDHDSSKRRPYDPLQAYGPGFDRRMDDDGMQYRNATMMSAMFDRDGRRAAYNTAYDTAGRLGGGFNTEPRVSGFASARGFDDRLNGNPANNYDAFLTGTGLVSTSRGRGASPFETVTAYPGQTFPGRGVGIGGGGPGGCHPFLTGSGGTAAGIIGPSSMAGPGVATPSLSMMGCGPMRRAFGPGASSLQMSRMGKLGEEYDPGWEDPMQFWDPETKKYPRFDKPRTHGHRFGPEDRKRDEEMYYLMSQDMPYYGDDHVPSVEEQLHRRQRGVDINLRCMHIPLSPLCSGPWGADDRGRELKLHASCAKFVTVCK